MRKTGPQNPYLQETIKDLKTLAIEKKVPLWKRVALELEKPTRSRISVNLSRINRYTKEGDIILVPGKVLAGGELNHKVQVVAWSFSEKAIDKIKELKGEVMNIKEYMKNNPEGKKTRIIG